MAPLSIRHHIRRYLAGARRQGNGSKHLSNSSNASTPSSHSQRTASTNVVQDHIRIVNEGSRSIAEASQAIEGLNTVLTVCEAIAERAAKHHQGYPEKKLRMEELEKHQALLRSANAFQFYKEPIVKTLSGTVHGLRADNGKSSSAMKFGETRKQRIESSLVHIHTARRA